MVKKTKQKTLPFTMPAPTTAEYGEIEIYEDNLFLPKNMVFSASAIDGEELTDKDRFRIAFLMPDMPDALEAEEETDQGFAHDHVSLSSDNEESSSEETSSEETDSETESEESSDDAESDDIEYNAEAIDYKAPVQEPDNEVDEDDINYVDPTQKKDIDAESKPKGKKKVKRRRKKKSKAKKAKKAKADGTETSTQKDAAKASENPEEGAGEKRRRRRKRRRRDPSKKEGGKMTIDIKRNALLENEEGPEVREKTPPKFKKGVSDKIRLMQMRFAAEQAENQAVEDDTAEVGILDAKFENKDTAVELEGGESDPEDKTEDATTTEKVVKADEDEAQTDQANEEVQDESGDSEYTYETESESEEEGNTQGTEKKDVNGDDTTTVAETAPTEV
jgi:hypothetical protein